MSVYTRTRSLFVLLLALIAPGLFAAFPSPRTAVRMAYDPSTTNMVMYGGVAAFDRGTARAYELDETWIWNGSRWIQRFLTVTPGGRYGHVMVTDPRNNRIVLWGGRAGTTDLTDTWIYQNNAWKKLDTPNSPPGRGVAAAAYDAVRGRIVLFGGNKGATGTNATTTPVYDTWEFDGANWIQRNANGPQVIQPTMAYHAGLDQMILVGGTTADATPRTYRYDPAAGTWSEVTTATKPSCTADAAASYSPVERKIIVTGGVCSNSDLLEEVWKFDGTDWAKVDTTTKVDRIYAFAQDFDLSRGQLVRFGGTAAFALPKASTYVLTDNWSILTDVYSPGPRSLYALATDPGTGTTYMFGGLMGYDYTSDFWKYRNGQWQLITATGGPTTCTSPNAAFDTDRDRLVLVCSDAATFEFDGTAWKTFTNLDPKPVFRRFSAMTYDQTLKRTVLFGGFDETNYLNRTWLWDGTKWTEQKNKKPTARSLTSMWFDPVQKKTILYGGIGRPTQDDGIERYDDMWSLDSTGWTKLTTTGTNPGMRYGAQTTVVNNRVLLFGGLLYEEKEEGDTRLRTQTFQNDLWEWNGTAWTKLNSTNAPNPRQNGAMFFDPSRGETVLFGGYGGTYFSDLWVLGANNAWTVRQETIGGRRRVFIPGVPVAGTSFGGSFQASSAN